MPIEYTKGDIFKADVEALVNSVNCVGVMGRGIALQFKDRFPANFKEYKDACDRGRVQPGTMFVTETDVAEGPRYIINFPSKRHWRGKSRIEDIETGLRSLSREIHLRKIKSIAIPALASDLGGLRWPVIRHKIESALVRNEATHIIVFEPGSIPADGRSNRSTDPPDMTPGRAALIALMGRYRKASFDPALTLLEIHKLMYFLQEAGEPLKLRILKEQYGPYAANLRHVLRAMNSHFITGYGEGGDAPQKPVSLLPGAERDAKRFLTSSHATYGRIERIAHLTDGFETPFGLELLTTVHWVAKHEEADTVEKAIAATYDWNEHKRQFSERQIQLAFDTLSEQGWISTLPDTSA